MRRFFGKIQEGYAIIDGDEFLHLKTVLRMKEGDDVVVLDGSEKEFLGKIKEIKKNLAIIQILSVRICQALPKKQITIFQAFTKKEKLELIVQKAVELGVKNFVPFSSSFCVAKDAIGKKDRFEKIVMSACKQCESSQLMTISDSLKFDDMLKCASENEIILFANERCEEKFDFSVLSKFNKIAVIVGPEGGFSEDEKKKIVEIGAKSLSLGKRILRSETASIVLLGIVSIMSEN